MKEKWPRAASAIIAVALFCWLAVVTMQGGLAGFDQMIRMHAHALATPWLTATAANLTWLGTLGVLALFGGLALAILVGAGHDDGTPGSWCSSWPVRWYSRTH